MLYLPPPRHAWRRLQKALSSYRNILNQITSLSTTEGCIFILNNTQKGHQSRYDYLHIWFTRYPSRIVIYHGGFILRAWPDTSPCQQVSQGYSGRHFNASIFDDMIIEDAESFRNIENSLASGFIQAVLNYLAISRSIDCLKCRMKKVVYWLVLISLPTGLIDWSCLSGTRNAPGREQECI